MDLARSANSLGVLVRLLFAVMITAAVFVDLWVIGRVWFLDRTLFDGPVLVIFGLGAVGLVWALRPDLILGCAIAAATLSVIQTRNAPGVGLRIGAFTEFVMLPVFLGATLLRPERARWAIAAGLAGAGLAVALRPEDAPIRAALALPMLALLGIACVVVTYLRLRDAERRASIEAARADERVEIARELHDVVGHHVTGIVVLAQANRFTSDVAPGSPTDRTFADIETAGIETLAALRRLIGVLRSAPTTATGPTLADIERIVADLAVTHPHARLVADAELRARWVPAELATTIQRLVQEAATNIRRHGTAEGPAEFRLTTGEHAVLLTVTNAFERRPTRPGFGLVGMRERVEALGGTFTAGAADGGGERWVVQATLPLTLGSVPHGRTAGR